MKAGSVIASDVISLVCTKWLGWDSLLADTYIPTTYIGNQFLLADSRDRMEMFLLELCHITASAHLGVSQEQKLRSLSSVWHIYSWLAHRNTTKLAIKGRKKYPWRCAYEICFPETYLIGQGGPLDHPSSPSVHDRTLKFHLAIPVLNPKAVSYIKHFFSQKAASVVLPTPEALDVTVYCICKVCPDNLRRWTKLHCKVRFKNPSKNVPVSPCEFNITRNSLHILQLTAVTELWMWLKMF